MDCWGKKSEFESIPLSTCKFFWFSSSQAFDALVFLLCLETSINSNQSCVEQTELHFRFFFKIPHKSLNATSFDVILCASDAVLVYVHRHSVRSTRYHIETISTWRSENSKCKHTFTFTLSFQPRFIVSFLMIWSNSLQCNSSFKYAVYGKPIAANKTLLCVPTTRHILLPAQVATKRHITARHHNKGPGW